MANKNNHLIVAYFDSAAAADEAAGKLKMWDKDRKDIKLGAMGIVTMEDGKLKTNKVGAYATSTGAKWGLVIGALAGIFTGGLSLIAGALAGLGLGALGGAGVHRSVGLSAEDKQKMMNHFEGGGAALAVMADDFEVEPTRAELAAFGGDVSSFDLGDDVMAVAEEAQETYTEAAEAVDANLQAYSDEEKAEAIGLLAASRSISVGHVPGLAAAGIVSVDALQERAATVEGRAAIADATGLDRAAVDSIAYDVDLGRVQGIGRKSRQLLNAAGVSSVGELAEYEPDELAGLMMTANEDAHVVDRMPSEDTIAFWIEQARELPPYIVSVKVLKEMMNVDDYSWTAREGDDPKKRRADAIMFNRKEGYEVRLMIQKICNTFGFETVEDVKRVESVIANELPGNVRSQENVYNWLVDYFATH